MWGPSWVIDIRTTDAGAIVIGKVKTTQVTARENTRDAINDYIPGNLYSAWRRIPGMRFFFC